MGETLVRPNHSAGSGQVGTDIRALRTSRRLTLAALARSIDRSIGWLSQVERGLTEPGIADLREIASHFDMPISFFFRNEVSPPEETGLIVRKTARAVLGAPDQGFVEELLSPDLSGDFEMIKSEFSPGASGGYDEPRKASEGGYLIQGQLIMWIGERRFELKAGDSFQFQNEACRWQNPGPETAVAIWIVSPPVY